MELTDQDVSNTLDMLEQSGHPDPAGFLARSEIISNLDHGFNTKDKFGFTGVRQEDLDRIGFGEAGEINNNIQAAIAVDMDNFSNFKDIDDTHVAFFGGGRAVKGEMKRPNDFLNNLKKGRESWNKRITDIKRDRESSEPEPVTTVLPTQGELLPSTDFQQPAQLAPTTPNPVEVIREQSQSVQPEDREVPESQTPESMRELRKFITKALRDG